MAGLQGIQKESCILNGLAIRWKLNLVLFGVSVLPLRRIISPTWISGFIHVVQRSGTWDKEVYHAGALQNWVVDCKVCFVAY